MVEYTSIYFFCQDKLCLSFVMITSHHILSRLDEEYLTSFTIRNKRTEVFLNPSRSEVSDFLKETREMFVRFIADRRNEAVYVWPGSYVLHEEIFRVLNLQDSIIGAGKTRERVYQNLLLGIAERESGKLYFIDSIRIEQFIHHLGNMNEKDLDKFEDFLFDDWSWLNYYVESEESLKQYRELYNEYVPYYYKDRLLPEIK
jgi:hypothetical protein